MKAKEWDITQARDGDIVADTDWEYPFVGIFQNLNDDGTFNVYCYMQRGKNPEFVPNYYLPLGGTYSTDNKTAKGIGPATEEQKKMFFDLMKEWGYKWDAEKKKLEYTEEKKRWVHKHAVFTDWPDDLPCTYCSAGWAMPWTLAKDGQKSTHQFMCRCLPGLFHDSIPSYNRDCKEAQEWFNQNRDKYELRDNEEWYIEPAFYFACPKYIKKED